MLFKSVSLISISLADRLGGQAASLAFSALRARTCDGAVPRSTHWTLSRSEWGIGPEAFKSGISLITMDSMDRLSALLPRVD